MNLTQLLLNSKLPIHELSEYESKKLKDTFLGMYKDIVFACKQFGLTVMLGGGSCLGAVRHQGFIPWDDDLDLNMLRADYDKFPAALEATFSGKYILEGPGVSDNYSLPFIKILKKDSLLRTVYDYPDENPMIGIDLFPLENIPDGKIERIFHGVLNNFYQYIAICVKLWQRRDCPITKLICSSKKGRKSLQKRFFIGRIFSYNSYQKWYLKCENIAKKYRNKKTEFITVPSGRCHYFGEIQSRSDIIPVTEGVFENLSVNLPNHYDTYLSSLYGNYMEIPPIEKREKHFIIKLDFGE